MELTRIYPNRVEASTPEMVAVHIKKLVEDNIISYKTLMGLKFVYLQTNYFLNASIDTICQGLKNYSENLVVSK